MSKKKPEIDENDDLDLGSIEDQKKKLKNRFFEACKKGNLEVIKKSLANELLDVFELDDNKWSALQWAVVSNQTEAVKIVFNKIQQLEKEGKSPSAGNASSSNSKSSTSISDFDEAFKKPLNPADNGKYTPLHWSAYKGLRVMSSILLKMGCDPMEVDSYGDNALHQAAAGNHYDTFKLFMSLGIDLDYKNSRSHKAIDLTTNKEVKNLINKSLNTKTCSICNKYFDFDNKRYLCFIKEEIICKDCAVSEYFYDSEDAKEKDLLECRCKNCKEEIDVMEKDLNSAIESGNLDIVKEKFLESHKYKICLHLKKYAAHIEDKLTREKEIRELLDSLKVVENHKTIVKSVFELDSKLTDAEKNSIELNKDLIDKVHSEKKRLMAEKELRQLLSNISIVDASQDNLNVLTEKIETAKSVSVAEEYTSKGDELAEKYRKNLDAKSILELFVAYPIREYPEPEEVDPKKKKKEEPKKKKKKKEPPFLVPDWAKELQALIDKVNTMKGYVKQFKDLGLDENFEKETKSQLSRFAKEIPFRKEEEEALRKLEEEKEAKKNKKKK